MKKVIVVGIALLAIFAGIISYRMLVNRQLGDARIEESRKLKENILLQNLNKFNINHESINILITVYKTENVLEIHAKNEQDEIYERIISYAVCSRSGVLGPKRQAGDKQVPEGFYYIDRFNPLSSFYLSLGINYPNDADKIKSTAENMGGDIFIHGSCSTVGCVPMTDDKIKEIYLYALYARENGQAKIPVYIFPFKMNDANWKMYKKEYQDNETLISFWENIKTGYDKFIEEQKELSIEVDDNGDYIFIK